MANESEFWQPDLAVGPEGNIYVSDGEGLRAYGRSGESLWQLPFTRANSLWAISDVGDLYVWSATLKDGRWMAVPARLDSRGQFKSSLPASGVVLPSGNLVGVRGRTHATPEECCEVISFRPSGEVIWTRPLPYDFRLPLAAAADGSFYGLGFADFFKDRYLIRFAPDGEIKWVHTFPQSTGSLGTPTFSEDSMRSPVVGADGTVYVGLQTFEYRGEETFSDRRLFAVAGDSPSSARNWPMSGHDPANRRSLEKAFFISALGTLVSQTSAVMNASITSEIDSLQALVLVGETAESLSLRERVTLNGLAPARTVQFAVSDLRPMETYYYSLTLSNRTTVVTTPVNSFQTAGPSENIEPTERALRFAVLAGGRVTFRTNGVIALVNSIPIVRDTVIDAIRTPITIDGQNLTRLFSIEGAEVSLAGLELVNGNMTGSASIGGCLPVRSAEPGFGGAVYISNSAVRFDSCVFSNCLAQGGDGSVLDPTCPGPPAPGYGGAIFAANTRLTMTNCAFYNSAAIGGTSALWQFPREGGGGGGIYARNSEVFVSHCLFRSNSAPATGSRLDVREGFGGALLISNTVAELRESRFSGNSSGKGGAVFTDSHLMLLGSSFDGNTALGQGSYGGGSSAFGGAVCAVGTNELWASGCTFTRNYARGGGGGNPGGSSAPAGDTKGGAIYSAPGFLRLTNCVIGLNKIEPSIYFNFYEYGLATGGGIYCSDAAIESSTIASNSVNLWVSSELPGAGTTIAGIFSEFGTVALHGVILSNQGTNGAGTFSDGGFNISSDRSISLTESSSSEGSDARLGIFEIADGFRGYFLPLADSPVVDAGDPLSFPVVDLRGVKRPYGLGPDIGALEWTPRLTVAVMRKGGQLVLSVSRHLGGKIVLEESSDLDHWEARPASFEGESIFVPVPEERSARFYRVREILDLKEL